MISQFVMSDRSHLPIDRGWAWVICFACAMQTFMIAGVFRSYGLLFVEFMEKYDASASNISLILSVQQILSSISSYFVMSVGMMLFTPRQLVLCGSLILPLAFFISTFVESLPVLMLTQGVLFGMGISFTMPPGLVLVGKYFEKRRGLTNSILKIGGGLGALSYAPFLRYLIEELSIDGTLLVLSGLLLNLLPCAALLRPLEFYDRPNRRKCIENGIKQPLMNGKISETQLDKIKGDNSYNELQIKSNGREVVYITDNDFGDEVKPYLHGSYDRLHSTARTKRIRTFSTNTDYDGTNVNHVSQHHSKLGKLVSTLSNSTVGLYGGIGDFGGSIASVACQETEKYVHSDDEDNKEQCCYNVRHVTCQQILDKLLDFKLFKNKVFLIQVFASQMGIIGIALANTYIPPYAKDIKIDPTKTSLLISVTSIADLTGKFITAFISDIDSIKSHRYLILAMAMLVFGVASQFISLLTNFTSLAIYCGVYGLSGGFFIAILTVVIIDFVGIENLSSAIGITILAQGSILAASAPVLGYLRDSTGSYILPFHVMGACAIVGGLALLMVPLVKRCESASKEDKTIT